ncbi:aminodeoxychorismate/anthranilate synthase component II [Lutimonas saemankumensis]|uniref:anthranilate synthase component II n=1 Tax=Lutimonas saemankumensis TaxID=483016 RepID=UPI001CD4B403|nr:aminodeoxychorismate/anthranilate synthase component II [Lutimonas saemankumensis]MCA0932563.1 aminodeoxychorismate/anthranilate synthase component II [Lutimonas saemankumensis]
MKNILVIDNYDSFTYNLVHYLHDLDCEVTVKRNDKLTLEEVEEFDKILLSPGPGIPDEAGLLKPIIKRYGSKKSILGICLGQQAIAEVYGGSIENLNKVYHGVSTSIQRVNEDEVLYKDIPEELEVGRYHSWVVSKDLPEELVVTSVDKNGEIMSLRHLKDNVRGVQYHPESILTPEGKKMLKNWVES